MLYQDKGANYKRADMGEEEATNPGFGQRNSQAVVPGDSSQAGSWWPVRQEQVRRVQMPHLRDDCFGMNVISPQYSYAEFISTNVRTTNVSAHLMAKTVENVS